MAVVTILNDFGAQENTVCHCFHFYPIYLPEVLSLNAMILVSWMLSFRPAFTQSSFTLIMRLFSSFLISAIRVPLDIFSISEVVNISPGSLDSSLWVIQLMNSVIMIYCAYKLNKQGDNIQLSCTPSPILNLFVVPWLVLTVASWHAYRFLRRKVK